MNCECLHDLYNTTYVDGYIGNGGSKINIDVVQKSLDIKYKFSVKSISDATTFWQLCEECFTYFQKAKSLFTDKTPHTINNLTVLIKLFPEANWDFEQLSRNPALRWEIVDMFDRSVWDIKELIGNPGISFANALELSNGNYDVNVLSERYDLSWDFVMEHADLAWDRYVMSVNAPMEIIKNNPTFGWNVEGIVCNSNLQLDNVDVSWGTHYKHLCRRFGWKYVEKFKTTENGWDWNWITSNLAINMWVLNKIPETKLYMDIIKTHNGSVWWDVIMEYPDERWNIGYAIKMDNCPKEFRDKYIYKLPLSSIRGMDWKYLDPEKLREAGWSNVEIVTCLKNCPDEVLIEELFKEHTEKDMEILLYSARWSVVKQFPNLNWSRDVHMMNGFEYDFILKRPDIDWDWEELSLTAPLNFIINNLKLPWEWENVSANYRLRWYYVYKYPTLPWNFRYISENLFFSNW
jgi:hypothetical protein